MLLTCYYEVFIGVDDEDNASQIIVITRSRQRWHFWLRRTHTSGLTIWDWMSKACHCGWSRLIATSPSPAAPPSRQFGFHSGHGASCKQASMASARAHTTTTATGVTGQMTARADKWYSRQQLCVVGHQLTTSDDGELPTPELLLFGGFHICHT